MKLLRFRKKLCSTLTLKQSIKEEGPGVQDNGEQENQNVEVNETSGSKNVINISVQRTRDIEEHDSVQDQWQMLGMPH
ncbi:unnamed protein product [Allacma fusca]|uniref:Uncharacterized protein n=1 Tax=Allacma fusca TaxID=39272 RepID=A0A8J2L343_9HEXA|nr:unnamed protein product [Allacma fusca]